MTDRITGTAHLAGTMIANIRRYQPELEISDREVFLVKAAGLCHDLGTLNASTELKRHNALSLLTYVRDA